MSRVTSKSRHSLAVVVPLVILTIIISVWPGGRARSAVAKPAGFTVTNLNDSGEGSLRDAINRANAMPDRDTITFADGLSGTITLTSGSLDIFADLSITGPGPSSIIVSGNHASDVFNVFRPANVQISGLTVRDGIGGIGNGGRLLLINVAVLDNAGTGIGNGTNAELIVENSTVSGNSTSGDGGGIHNPRGFFTFSSVFLSGVTVSNNSAGGNGGGVYNESLGLFSINNCTISGNTAANGGGIYNINNLMASNTDAVLNVTNSTVSGNSASANGGGIYNAFGSVSLLFATVAGNSARSGGGIFDVGSVGVAGPLDIHNSIIANNPAGGDCAIAGPQRVTGVNFTTNGTCPGFTQVTPAQLRLGPLADNGGSTQTRALLAGSVAIDAASDCIAVDQRGVHRPQGNACDVGAYEFVPCNAPPTITCPANVTAAAAPACPLPTNAVVVYATPVASSTCSSVTTSCTPPSGSTFPVGTSSVNCTATDANGNTASCVFSVTVFTGCVQDDANPRNVVLYNHLTGEYRFCCDGAVVASGVGSVHGNGCTVVIIDNTSAARVQITTNAVAKTGSASVQSPGGGMRCRINDRDTRNNACACQ